jgi:hypothetical protein
VLVRCNSHLKVTEREEARENVRFLWNAGCEELVK